MAEGCPARTTLEAFATDIMTARQRDDLEAHLTHCLGCAEEIDELTRAQLAGLIGKWPSPLALPLSPSPVLDGVIRKAAGSVGTVSLFDPDCILTALDAPTADGALGAFAGYDVLEIAGRGGMGVVLKARDRTLDRFVAIKVILPFGRTDEPFAANFLEEARAAAAIQHDHIVVVHHAGMAKGLPYLVMPFHSEGTLEQQLARAPKLPPRQVARVGLQLARALAATHARGILHRDIKPSNVLLEDKGERVRLADFGLARTRHLRTDGTRTIAGTPQYMSPEQARGKFIDGRSDLFSLGAVLFEMATGRTLYTGESSNDVLTAATRCELKPIRLEAPELAAPLAAIIDRLLAKRPDDRFASAADVASALERFVHAEGPGHRRAKRIALAVGLATIAVITASDWTGRTAIVNSLWCRQTGDSYYLRGRFGTHARLSDAVAAARPHAVIEARFSGEQLTESFRLDRNPLTIRAARGFRPILLATNNAQPLITVDAPLALEGLMLWRRGPVVNFALLISVENAPLHLLNCRLLRSGHQGQDVLVHGRLRVSPTNDSSRYRALLGFERGSVGYLRNCVVAGTLTSGIGVRASADMPTRVEIDNSLFAVDRGICLNQETETGVHISAARSVFVTGLLADLSRPTNLQGITLSWSDCILDRAQGALLRLARLDDGTNPASLEWKESRVVYAGQGGFAKAERESVIREENWNRLVRLGANSHQLVEQQAFPEICVRSCLTLSAVDLDMEVVNSRLSGGAQFSSTDIGEGAQYERFRQTPAYRQWRQEVHASVREWEAARTRSQAYGP